MLHRHAIDVVALVSGTIFAGLAAVWLLIITEAVDVEQAWIGGPVILIVAGVLGLLVTLIPSRSEPAPVLGPVGPDPDAPAESTFEPSVQTPTVSTDDEQTTVLPSAGGEPGEVAGEDPEDTRTES